MAVWIENVYVSLTNMVSQQNVKVDPYQSLASIYDEVMTHVDYEIWTRFILDLCVEYGLPTPDLLNKVQISEFGCGTGNFAIRLALLGYQVSGSDSSSEMIKIAESKAQILENKPLFEQKGFLEIDYRDDFDCVLCVYDSVNYLMSEELVLEYFERVNISLKDEGLFFFDVFYLSSHVPS